MEILWRTYVKHVNEQVSLFMYVWYGYDINRVKVKPTFENIESILTYGNLSFRDNFELEKAPSLCVWTGKKRKILALFKHCVSLTFWYGSGSADPYC
jgi:hypothetical protein